MSYYAEWQLTQDPAFAGRLESCLCTEAQPRDEPLAETILSTPELGTAWFMPFVSTAPGFGAAAEELGQSSITDGMLLAAVQSVWDDVAALHEPETPPETPAA